MKVCSLTLSLAVFILWISDHSYAENPPEFRPALLTRGPRSLVNLIDAKSLMKRGQGDAIVMFSCSVNARGECHEAEAYRGTPHSELLTREIVDRAEQSEFIPAIYHHIPTDVYLDATVSFFVTNGQPHIRVFLNQEDKDLTNGSNFIAPQFAFVSTNMQHRGIYWPPNAPGHDGTAAVTLDVDANGRVHGAKVAYEYPPGMGFGEAVAGPILDGRFIPGFRDGKAVPCRFTWSLRFFGRGRQMQTG